MDRSEVRRTAQAATGLGAAVWVVCTAYVLYWVVVADLTASQRRAVVAFSRDPAAAFHEPFVALVIATSLLGAFVVVAGAYWRHRRWYRAREELLVPEP